LFLAFARLLFILAISSFDVFARNMFARKLKQTAYTVHSFHLLACPGRALTLAGLKRAGLKISDRKGPDRA